jgi:hypothetical protein
MNGTTHLRHQIQSARGTREERPPGVMLPRWLPAPVSQPGAALLDDLCE